MCCVSICNVYHVSLTIYIRGTLETKSCPLTLSCLSECNNPRSAESILKKSDIEELTFLRKLNFFGQKIYILYFNPLLLKRNN